MLYIYWTPNNSIQFRYSSFIIWFMISLYISNILGAYQIIIFTTLQILYFIGFIYEVVAIMENQELENKHMTFIEAMCFALTNNLITNTQQDSFFSTSKSEDSIENISEESINNETNREDQDIKIMKLSRKTISLDANRGVINRSQPSNVSLRDRYLLRRLKTELRMSIDIENDKVDTDKYMCGALYACIGMLLWKHRWMIYILIIPIAFYIIKQLGSYFGIWKMIGNQCNIIVQIIKTWCTERHQALLPVNVRGLYKIGIIVDEKLTKVLKASVDSVVTIAVIFGLLVFTTCTSIFITIQV